MHSIAPEIFGDSAQRRKEALEEIDAFFKIVESSIKNETLRHAALQTKYVQLMQSTSFCLEEQGLRILLKNSLFQKLLTFPEVKRAFLAFFFNALDRIFLLDQTAQKEIEELFPEAIEIFLKWTATIFSRERKQR